MKNIVNYHDFNKIKLNKNKLGDMHNIPSLTVIQSTVSEDNKWMREREILREKKSSMFV